MAADLYNSRTLQNNRLQVKERHVDPFCNRTLVCNSICTVSLKKFGKNLSGEIRGRVIIKCDWLAKGGTDIMPDTLIDLLARYSATQRFQDQTKLCLLPLICVYSVDKLQFFQSSESADRHERSYPRSNFTDGRFVIRRTIEHRLAD